MYDVWQVRLFGTLCADREGQPSVTRFRTRKTGALFAFLALAPDRTHGREELADLFWPDADPEMARANLRSALASLRRQFEGPGVPEGSVIATPSRAEVRLAPGAVETDVAEFDRRLKAARVAGSDQARAAALLAEAVEMYHGPLLPGYYETWALTERDRLAEAYQNALARLVEHYSRAGDTDTALQYARRAVTADSLSEDAHAAVIRLLLARGEHTAARRQFQELSRLLQDSMGVEPAPEVRALLASASAGVPLDRVAASPRKETGGAVPPAVPLPSAAVEPAPQPAPEQTAVPLPPVRLPATVTRFFGREDERIALGGLLTPGVGTRLVTLTGPGGSGKTRLALETARDLARGGSFPGGAWFVGLSDMREPGRVPDLIADALGLTRTPGSDPLEQAAAALDTPRPALLVLDNYEQLVDEGGADVVRALLARAPALSCLVTSRQRLQIEGEWEFPLPPLPVPSHPGTPGRLLEFASVQMFVDRARAARADFQLTPRNAEAVAALCEKLEGMPLAIELAAAWAQTLAPAQMLSRLQQRFNLLVTRRRDVPGRHTTLRATVEWSYDLLPADLRRFFARLSVFHGGWTLEAAEAVLDDPAAIDHLAALRERSLLLAEEEDGGMRFGMLETLREFAEERQIDGAAPGETDALRARHARWCLELAEEVAPHLSQPHPGAWMDRLQTEQDNLRAALGFLLAPERGDVSVEAGLRLAVALFRFWQTRGPIAEGQEWLERGLRRAEGASGRVDPLVEARAREHSGTLAWYRSDLVTAQARLEEGIALYRRIGHGLGVASAINSLVGMQNITSGPGDVRRLLEDGLGVLQEMGDGDGAVAGRLLLLEALTRDAAVRHHYDDAERFGDEYVRLARRGGDSHHRAAAPFWLGLTILNRGDHAGARALLVESLDTARAVGEVLFIASPLWGFGYMALFEGDAATAGDLHRQALRAVAGATGYDFSVAYIVEALALVALAESRTAEAARLLGGVSVLERRLGYPLAPVVARVDRRAAEADARRALGESAFDRRFAEGAHLSAEEVVREALREPVGAPSLTTPQQPSHPVGISA